MVTTFDNYKNEVQRYKYNDPLIDVLLELKPGSFFSNGDFVKFSGNFTKGKFPPFPINAIKSTNNIGQFSNIDLRKYENSKTIISIGDSYVEAAQVSNKNSSTAFVAPGHFFLS